LFIKKTTKHAGGKTYVNHLLVESVATPNGPRHRVLCSLGPLAPAPQDDWLALAHRIETALSGQQSIESEPTVDVIVGKIEKPKLTLQNRRRPLTVSLPPPTSSPCIPTAFP